MKIALITYEYPPDTAFGGIATYVNQSARMMCDQGHHVEVFCGSHRREGGELDEGITINRVKIEDRQEFTDAVAPIFFQRHNLINFDVLESPEIGAEAKHIIRLVPHIPLVVKLHTPSFLCAQLGYLKPSFEMKIRRFFGALRRFQIPKSFPIYTYDAKEDSERSYCLEADEITTPSMSLGLFLSKKWSLLENKIHHIPNPYTPSQELLDIPCDTETNTISFIGRLEARKGILDLSKTVPLVLKQFPNVKFRFIGSGSAPSPEFGLDMQAYLIKNLRKFQNSLEFTGRVELRAIPSFLEQTDICVFPSIWENFPYTCLEAMSAGRGIVASNAGGMSEMLDGGKAGCLIPPRDHEAIAKAICKLLADPALRRQLGQAARKRVLSEYNNERIGALQEASYERAIKRRKELGDR